MFALRPAFLLPAALCLSALISPSDGAQPNLNLTAAATHETHEPAEDPPFEEEYDESAEGTDGGYSPPLPPSTLQVHEPDYLFKSGGYDHRVALFGTPLYGALVQEYVYYADSTLCDPAVDTRKGYPLRPTDETGAMMPWPTPFILLVDRGGCTFVTKVRHAQLAGAAAVIIADNTCLCSAGDRCMSSPSVDCEARDPIMADDGSGGDIMIPSVLMFKQDADPIKAELRANRMVLVEMSWRQSPTANGPVEYEMWTTPKDMVSRDLMRSFGGVAEALGSNAHFTPHMYIYDGIKAGCIDYSDGSNLCYNLCTNAGRYCATDPDNDLDSGESGADVVTESLRRLCIWNLYGAGDGVGIRWWRYVDKFDRFCADQGRFTDASCVNAVFNAVGINGASVKRCMIDNGGLEGNHANALLDQEIRIQEQKGIVIVPTIRVNGFTLSGNVSPDNLFAAICRSFAEDWAPDVCVECAECPRLDGMPCTTEGLCKQTEDDTGNNSQVDDCTLECYNRGVCSGNRCICPNGFSGFQCEFTFEVCKDGHRCENGGKCVHHPDSDYSYLCDCSNATSGGLPSVGLYCENTATAICSQGSSGTSTSFCTNGGVCAGQVHADAESHGGCECPMTHQGKYCEYVVGTVLPSGWTPEYENNDANDEAVCPDEERVCVNGGECRAWPDGSGVYYCNCDAALSGGVPHSGESCEVPATTICNIGSPYTSFCTNGGECISIVPPGEIHIGCRCKDEYEGAFCQLAKVLSSATKNLRTAHSHNSGASNSSSESWKLALATALPVCAAIALAAAVLAMQHAKMKGNENQEKNDNNSLPAADSSQGGKDRGENRSVDKGPTSKGEGLGAVPEQCEEEAKEEITPLQEVGENESAASESPAEASHAIEVSLTDDEQQHS